MDDLNAVSWNILDAMADDWESVEQIEPFINEYVGLVSRDEIIKAIEDLYNKGLIEIMDNEKFSRLDILKDPSKYWFGMTDAGRKLWNSESNKYIKE
jgi:hypothetical protein